MYSFKVSAPVLHRRYDLEASWAFSSTKFWWYYLDLTIRAYSRTTAGPPLSFRTSIELTCGSRNFIFSKRSRNFLFWFFALFRKQCPKSEEKHGFWGRLGWRCPSLECALSNWPSHFFDVVSPLVTGRPKSRGQGNAKLSISGLDVMVRFLVYFFVKKTKMTLDHFLKGPNRINIESRKNTEIPGNSLEDGHFRPSWYY